MDTQKPLEDFIVHKAKLSAPLKVGDKVHAAIDVNARNRTRGNHSATHLLHKALRDLLGEHVTQKGSLVAPDRLRFDFSHGKGVAKEEIAVLERKVNEQIANAQAVQCREMAPDAAIAAGAMALFGEKYGDKVRVLNIGNSVELCGGTHVRSTGDIGLFKITSEGSVAAGIRRIEGVTGEGVREYMISEVEHLLTSLRGAGGSAAIQTDLEKTPLMQLPAAFEQITAQLQTAITAQLETNKKRAKEEAERKKQAALGSGEVNVEQVGNLKFIGKAFDGLDPKDLRDVATGYLKQADVVALATNVEGKASVLVAVGKEQAGKVSAVPLVQAAVAKLGGKGGGGKPEMAQGGGPDAAQIASALDEIKSSLKAA